VSAPPTEPISWRKLALPIYGPTVLVAIGYGAILPLVALSARELGASPAVAAFVVGLMGLGQLVGDLPAGALAARIGEKWALIGACVLDAIALLGAFLAPNVLVLALAVFGTGLAGAVFSLARQAYLTAAVPVATRARAMSTLGGTFRIGTFIGPFVGAAIVSVAGIAPAYAFTAGMTLAAAVLAALLPDLPATDRRPNGPNGPNGPARRRSVISVLAEHRRVLLTLGTGVLFISAARSTRQSIVPLWADAQGIDAATTALIFGVSAGVDMLLFSPGGAIMDRFGRVWVAVPSMIVLGLGFGLLPLATDAFTIGLVACLMGLGNGISAGIVLTLGADLAPAGERAQFLGGWRLCADLGNTLGPFVVGGVTVLASLAVASWTMFGVTWLGSGWLAKWVPVHAAPPARRPVP
jgi:MFS family permease